jgi:hypothetical protein
MNDEEQDALLTDDDTFIVTLPFSLMLSQTLLSTPRRPQGLFRLASLFDSYTDQVIVQDAVNESMTTYYQELGRKDENIQLGSTNESALFSRATCRNHKCFICLEDFGEGEGVVRTRCTHVFHRECIQKAIQYNPRCPICKHAIDTQEMRREHDKME